MSHDDINADADIAGTGGSGIDAVVGVDVGGTKLAIRAETLAGDRIIDAELSAEGWEADPADAAASWLLERLRRALPGGSRIAALGLGAQGCDSPAAVAALQRALGSHGLRVVVVNDGALLVPAAGLDHGIGIVVGTGSIGIGTDAAGRTLQVGGWGWVLGDEGGAAALVREGTKAALRAHDEGRPDDGLLAALQRAFGVTTAERLARAVNDDPTVPNWAPHARAVFAAADNGSALAVSVILDAAGSLSSLVSRLITRGAVGRTVVAAGRVVVHQPRLAQALRDQLSQHHPEVELQVLDVPPVAGAITLARRLLTHAAAQPRREERTW
jgi:N-acetylglucosamine kinase-like BadF-type ATPase